MVNLEEKRKKKRKKERKKEREKTRQEKRKRKRKNFTDFGSSGKIWVWVWVWGFVWVWVSDWVWTGISGACLGGFGAFWSCGFWEGTMVGVQDVSLVTVL